MASAILTALGATSCMGC
ncbi:MAG: hypothetical protein IJ742_00980 [Prevotella sp.]|nr:hypothetical protein [Prevotella sp.]